MLITDSNNYFLCCYDGLLQVLGDQTIIHLKKSFVTCVSRISEDEFIIGTTNELLVYNIATKEITNTLTSGYFNSIRKVTENSFIAMDEKRLLLIQK